MRHAQLRAIMDDILSPAAKRRCFCFQSQTKRHRLIRTEKTACRLSGRDRLVVDRILLSKQNAHISRRSAGDSVDRVVTAHVAWQWI
jgi:hypothetical protein